MTLLEILRNQTFWMMDRLKGGLVFQGLNILERIEGGRLTEEEVAVYQQEQIEKLLRHCRQTVPAYKDIKDIDLKAWPIVNKAILKEGGVAYHSIIFNKNDLFTMATSGSTGTPFISYQDLGKKKHVNAEVLFYNGKIDYKIGKRIIYFRSVVNEVAKSPLQQFMQNIYLLDCQDLSDSGIVQKLRKIKCKV
jgi:phenylacetate-CoA ligase